MQWVEEVHSILEKKLLGSLGALVDIKVEYMDSKRYAGAIITKCLHPSGVTNSGFAELLSLQLKDDKQERETVAKIISAAGRAKDLTRKLLSFVRRGNNNIIVSKLS